MCQFSTNNLGLSQIVVTLWSTSVFLVSFSAVFLCVPKALAAYPGLLSSLPFLPAVSYPECLPLCYSIETLYISKLNFPSLILSYSKENIIL